MRTRNSVYRVLTVVILLALLLSSVPANSAPAPRAAERKGYPLAVAVPGLHNYAPEAPILPFETARTGAELTNTPTASPAWDVSIFAEETVTVTHWVDPEGRQPITYEEWKGKAPPRGPFTVQKVLERRGDLVPPQTLHKVCVIVNATLYSSIQASVDQYASDLEAEGYTVVVHSTSGGTPNDIRTLLQGELPGDLVGCLLVGDLPVPWYEMDDDFYGYAEFPIDLYYMDLDGQWTDADVDGKFDDHTDGVGDVAPDIWVGRLTASPLAGDEATRVQNYFSKNHQYRTGNLTLAHRALSYIYDDWSGFGTSGLDLIYGDNVTVMAEKGKTSAEDYKDRLSETHRFVHVMAHSSPGGHSFSDGWVSSTEIDTVDPRAFFYNLFACSNARYVENDYMGGYYIFAPTYGLAAMGTTKTGSMLSFEQFYGPLGEEKTLGEAYHEWFEYKAQGGFSLGEKQWHYGMTLLGDPTLTVVDTLAPTASILSPDAHEYLYATTTIAGAAADANFANYTLEHGPGTSPVTWTQLISSSSPMANGTLATWDTRAFSGTYTFRLTVNANGRSNEDRITARVKNAEITSPVLHDILGPGLINITGTAAIMGFQDYVIEYGVGENPASWSSTGISLAGGGLSEVINHTLATMDTTLMGGINDYTIRLMVNSSGGLVYQDKVMIHVDPTLQVGWPQSVDYRIVAPSMAIGDIDGDGDLEIVATEGKYGVYNAKAYAWHHDGTMVNGWPQQTSGGRLSSPALADVDRDGDLEIIVGSDDWRVYVWHHDGKAAAGWPQRTGDDILASPAVGDIDGDGVIEIIVGSFDDKVYVWHYDGTTMNGWPQTAGDSVYSSPALGDLDGDGDREIVVGAHDGNVYAWHHNGVPVSGWPVTTTSNVIFSSPALGDIDGNGDIEVLIGGDNVYAWHHDGTVVTGWPQSAGWSVDSAPALGDMDGDGDLEIVVGSDQVYAWHGDGTAVSGWPVAVDYSTESSPVLGDIDGDGDIEVVIGPGEADGHTYAWHHDGNGVADWPRVVPHYEGSGRHYSQASSPILEDVDQDGDIEVAIGVEGKVMIWDLAGTYKANIEWQMFHHDLWHTGFYSSSLPNLSPFVRDVEASPGYVAPGSGVTITAKVSDEDGVSSVTAEIESPDETVHGTITLYDDGVHNDGAAGDGTYGNTWTTLSTRLDYVIDIIAVDGLAKSYTHDNVASFTTQDVAYVQYNTYTINYDNINYDGIANPGEYVQFSITLENIGVLSAPGVTATISTGDSHIWYYDTGAASFGDVLAGGTATCGSYDYYIRVSNTCPHSHTVTFDLDAGDSNGNTWSDSFDVTIIDNVGPAIPWAEASPRYTVAGEPVAITAYVQDGSGVSSVQAVIESPDETPVITVTLHDDGAHDDGGANDGTFGNTWTTDVTQRNYYVDFITEDGLANVRACDNLTMFTTKAFSKTSNILFVPDYGDDSTEWFQSYYTDALDSLSYGYDVWDTQWREAPDSDILNLYTDGVVIWAVPYWGYFADWDVQPDIEAYLDAGGRLFVTGQNVASHLNGHTLLSDYLHATYVQDDTNLYTLNGVTDDPIGDGLVLGISGGDGANNQYDTDEIAPIAPAVTVFTYDPSGTGGLRVDTGIYKVVYFSFGFEGINSADDRATVMGRVLAWLQGILPPVASFTSSSPDWLGQETVFANTTIITGPVSYLWAFGDGVTSTLESPTHTYGSPGAYTVVLTATNVLGSDVATDTATIYELPTVRIVPASRYVNTESTSTFVVTVQDAQNLGGFDFDLTFDPALLQVDDVTLGDFLGSTGRSTDELGPGINNDAGMVTFGASSFGSQDGPNGAGTLAVLTFTTFITPGVSALDLQDVQLADTEVQTQPVQAVGGSVTILAGPRIGSPSFADSVLSNKALTVTAHITDTASGTGVANASLRYGYTIPYTQSSVLGSGPGGNGNGEWTFAVPPQGDNYEGHTLHFSLVAQNGNTPPDEMVDDNAGSTYSVSVTDDDTAPPIFSNPAPAIMSSAYSITLQVDIADAESGVADNDALAESVYVEWDTDGEFAIDAHQADMDWVSGATYAMSPPIAPLSAGITVAWRVYAEDDDNSPAGGWTMAYETGIMPALLGDLDYDCDVDVDDIMIVVARWNSETGDPDYDSRYDFDSDGDVDVLDVIKVAVEWGNTCGGMAAVRSALAARLGQDAAQVRFDPPAAVAQVGVPLTVDITIAQMTDLGGFEFDLLFDSDVITVTDVHPSNFLASSGNNAAILGPRYEESGRLVFGGFSYGEHEGVSGYGKLATLELVLLEDTEAVLSLEDVQLTTSDAEQISLHSVDEGRVRTRAYIYLPLVIHSQ